MKRFLSIVLFLILIFSPLIYVKANSEGIVKISADKVSDIKVGDEVTITLSFSETICAGDFKVYYDKDYLKFKSSSIIEDHFTDNSNQGIIDISTFSFPVGYDSVTFTFEALKGGNTNVSFSANGEDDGIYFNQDNELVVDDVSISLGIDYIINTNWNKSIIDNKNVITGIQPGTTIDNILNSLNYSGNIIVKTYIGDNEVVGGKATTNTIIKVLDDSNTEIELKRYYILIYGDVAPNGSIGSLDALSIIKNKINNKVIDDEIILEAARVSKNTRISKGIPGAIDALQCIKYKLKLGTIEQ